MFPVISMIMADDATLAENPKVCVKLSELGVPGQPWNPIKKPRFAVSNDRYFRPKTLPVCQ